MEEKNLSVEDVKRRVIPAIISLVGRQAALQLITFITINLVLAAVLPVRVIGIFDIASSIIIFFQYFSDIGLAASLIQKKEDVDHLDIKTTFTIQTLIAGFLSLIIILGAPFAGSHYGFDESGVWLIRVLGISFSYLL